jgi:tetratricopeptide (TPR) repeat protein
MCKIILACLVTVILPLVAIANNSAKYFLDKGISEYKKGNIVKAQEYLTNAISNDNAMTDAFMYRGHAYAEIGQVDLALSDYKKVLEILPETPEAYFYIGVIWYEMKDYGKAIASYTDALKKKHNYLEAIVNRGWSYLEVSKYLEAEQDFKASLEIEPHNANALSGLAKLYSFKKEYDSSLLLYDKAIKYHADDPIIYHLRASLYCDLKNHDKAIFDYNRAITINSKYVDAYKSRGNCLADMGKKELAINDYTKVIELADNDVWAYNNRAYTYYEMGKYDEALLDYNKAINIDPSIAELFYGRSELFVKMNKQDDAWHDAKEASRLQPDNIKYLEWLKTLNVGK